MDRGGQGYIHILNYMHIYIYIYIFIRFNQFTKIMGYPRFAGHRRQSHNNPSGKPLSVLGGPPGST